MTLKYSIFLPQGFVHELGAFCDPIEAYETLTAVAQTVEACGFDTVWVADHLHTATSEQHHLFESWTTVAALLRDTSRIRIGQMVTCNDYRNPALQAKMASSVDVLGHGRFTFGIGAGWHEPDYQAYGYEFRAAPERLKRLREAVQIILSLWTELETTFDGEYYQVKNAINQPKGIQQPHIPLMIAGEGEQVTLKLVAEFADMCNVTQDPIGMRHKFEVLKKHCEAVGRNYDEIHRTVQTHCVFADSDEEAQTLVAPWTPAVFPGDVRDYGLVGNAKTIRDRLKAYEDAGAQELAISFAFPENPDTYLRFAEEFMGN
ncbi:LLM class F420-dependent oxidoreductase [Amycolatopsis sp. NPDC059657]|uniref:LLM class F420-dependent oxidoreductase n=1 Tax=Amycolatopsis sp. NPDC059657 TaxID=3346899 RepID=UPI00366C70F5